MGGPSGGPTLGSVTLTDRGWVAGFGDQLVGTYASEELAQRCLDILRLKSGQDAGLAPDAVELALPLAVSGALSGVSDSDGRGLAARRRPRHRARGALHRTMPHLRLPGHFTPGAPACARLLCRTTWTRRPPQSCAAST